MGKEHPDQILKKAEAEAKKPRNQEESVPRNMTSRPGSKLLHLRLKCWISTSISSRPPFNLFKIRLETTSSLTTTSSELWSLWPVSLNILGSLVIYICTKLLQLEHGGRFLNLDFSLCSYIWITNFMCLFHIIDTIQLNAEG